MLFIASVINEWMVRSVGAIILTGEGRTSRRKLQHKSRIEWPKLEPCLRGDRPANKPPELLSSCWYAFRLMCTWETCVIGAIKSILIAAANESVFHQIAVIYLSRLSFHSLLQSCRRYQSTCARTGRRNIQIGCSMGRRFRRAGLYLSHTLRV